MARYAGPSKLVAPPPRGASRCVAAAPRSIGKSAIVAGPARAPSVAIAATTEGVLAAWTTTNSPTPTPVLDVAMLSRDGTPNGEPKRYPLDYADYLAAAPLVDGSFVVFAGGMENARGSRVQVLTFGADGTLASPIASEHVDGRGAFHFKSATAAESGAALVGWTFQSNGDVIHYYLLKAVFQHGEAAYLVSGRVADEKFPDWGNSSWIKLGPGERGLVEWRGGAWQLGGGKLTLEVEPEKRRQYASFAFEADGALVGSTAIEVEGEEVPGYRRSAEGAWAPTKIARRQLWNHAPPFVIRDLHGKAGGIALAYGDGTETAITTSDVPDGRSSVAWTGERFLAAFPIQDPDGFSIDVSAVTCTR